MASCGHASVQNATTCVHSSRAWCPHARSVSCSMWTIARSMHAHSLGLLCSLCRQKCADKARVVTQGTLAQAISLPQSAALGHIGPPRASRTRVLACLPAGSASAQPPRPSAWPLTFNEMKVFLSPHCFQSFCRVLACFFCCSTPAGAGAVEAILSKEKPP